MADAPPPSRPARLLLGAAAAAVLLAGGAAVLAILRITDEPRQRAAPETIAAPLEAAPAPRAVARPVEVEPDTPPEPRAEPAAAARTADPVPEVRPPEEPPRPAAPAPVDWQAVAVQPVHELPEAVADALAQGLERLEAGLRSCAGEERGEAGAEPPPPRPLPGMVLHLAVRPGQVVLVDAVPEEDEPGERLPCARQLLRGQVFDAPGAQDGQHFRAAVVLVR